MQLIDEIVKVGERGQIVIPAKIRAASGIRPRSYVRVIHVRGQVLIDQVKVRPVEKVVRALAALKLTEADWERIKKERDVDSVVAATGLVHRCQRVLSEDEHFDILQRRGLIKKQCW